MNKRMDRTKLHIGTYILAPYARTEQHIRELAECGINVVVGVERDEKMLDLFEKYHVGAIVNRAVPGWWGGNGANAGTLQQANPLQAYEESAAQFRDHAAVWGIDVGDEPSALDFPHYGAVVRRTDALFADQFAFLNIYPSYGDIAKNTEETAKHQLGTADYKAYIEAYCTHVPTDYISYDHYLYTSDVNAALRDLQTVSDACRRTERSMWIVLQVNSSDPQRCISENQLRFQAFSAMAHGAEVIFWACYTAGWFHHQVLDKNGEKTEQYEKLRTVNRAIRHLAEPYMQYRTVAVHQTAGDTVLCAASVQGLHAENGERLLVGEMTARDGSGRRAFMLCAADDPYDVAPKENRVMFETAQKAVTLVTETTVQTLHADENGLYHFVVPSCGGALLMTE